MTLQIVVFILSGIFSMPNADLAKRADVDEFSTLHPEYRLALESSEKMNRPVLILFTGIACENVKKANNQVQDAQIQSLINNDFVFLSLYVDDKTALSNEEQFVDSNNNRTIGTVGRRNMYLQLNKFNCNSQPFFAVLDSDGEVIDKSNFLESTDELADFIESSRLKYSKK